MRLDKVFQPFSLGWITLRRGDQILARLTNLKFQTVLKNLPRMILLSNIMNNNIRWRRLLDTYPVLLDSLEPGHTSDNLSFIPRTTSLIGDVLATVLALYMHDKNQPLPSHEEVLICTPETTTEEVISRECWFWVKIITFTSLACDFSASLPLTFVYLPP